MPNYAILVNWTDQGIKNVKDSIRRDEAFETAIEKVGGKSIGLYYTLGKHDIVAVVQAPNDEAITSVLYLYWKPKQCTVLKHLEHFQHLKQLK